jgi:hypothetical protein
LALLTPKLHVNALHLSARKLPLDVEIQAHERKCDPNPLALAIRPLSGERVDNMLMNERRSTVRECIAAELVIGVLL